METDPQRTRERDRRGQGEVRRDEDPACGKLGRRELDDLIGSIVGDPEVPVRVEDALCGNLMPVYVIVTFGAGFGSRTERGELSWCELVEGRADRGPISAVSTQEIAIRIELNALRRTEARRGVECEMRCRIANARGKLRWDELDDVGPVRHPHRYTNRRRRGGVGVAEAVGVGVGV